MAFWALAVGEKLVLLVASWRVGGSRSPLPADPRSPASPGCQAEVGGAPGAGAGLSWPVSWLLVSRRVDSEKRGSSRTADSAVSLLSTAHRPLLTALFLSGLVGRRGGLAWAHEVQGRGVEAACTQDLGLESWAQETGAVWSSWEKIPAPQNPGLNLVLPEQVQVYQATVCTKRPPKSETGGVQDLCPSRAFFSLLRAQGMPQ